MRTLGFLHTNGSVAMAAKHFFESLGPQSVIKTKIVTKYFGAWSQVMLSKVRTSSDSRIAYFDLFAGPGRFEDGKASTPLWILNHALQNEGLRRSLVTQFNDKNHDFAEQLRSEIASLPGVEALVHPPVVTEFAVGNDLVDQLRQLRLVPTLFFIDPWGYKGLSLDLIGTAIKSWGCDCIFFFNYNRVNPGLTNDFVYEHINDLFGRSRAEDLRSRVDGKSPDQRQTIIIESLLEALDEIGGSHVLTFEFESQHGERPSHYLIFVSKEFRGYHIMKEVMARLSSDEGEVKNFRYVPFRSSQMALFGNFWRSHSIDSLKRLLMASCASRSQRVEDIYEENSVGTTYTFKNVQEALLALEADGRVVVDVPVVKRMRKGKATLGKDRTVTFPD